MNVYDFDKTIYKKDCTVQFYLYCLKKYPKIVIKLPKQLFSAFCYFIGKKQKIEFKQDFYSFLSHISNVEEMVNEFWEKEFQNIQHWYLKQKKDDDLIISASPEFLILPICKTLKVRSISSNVDSHTGRCVSPNCYGKEKVIRLKEEYENYNIDKFYSDSYSDEPLALLSKEAFIVQGDTISPWGIQLKQSIFQMFFNKEFILFIFIGVINTVNGVLFSTLYSLFLQPNIAFIVGYCTSLFISYLLNSFITFKEPLSFAKFIKFSISYIPNFIIQNIIVFIFFNLLLWNKVIVYGLAAFIGIPVTFICLKVFAFSKK